MIRLEEKKDYLEVENLTREAFCKYRLCKGHFETGQRRRDRDAAVWSGERSSRIPREGI